MDSNFRWYLSPVFYAVMLFFWKHFFLLSQNNFLYIKTFWWYWNRVLNRNTFQRVLFVWVNRFENCSLLQSVIEWITWNSRFNLKRIQAKNQSWFFLLLLCNLIYSGRMHLISKWCGANWSIKWIAYPLKLNWIEEKKRKNRTGKSKCSSNAATAIIHFFSTLQITIGVWCHTLFLFHSFTHSHQ